MYKKNQSLKQTIQLIVDILSFERSDDDLKQQLSNTDTDWDQMVIVASKHLVLPAVYCRLQQKSLLGFLPEDLVFYLEELTQLNRERNLTLLDEIKNISELFQKNQIQYVFIKGIALLVGNYYKDIGERMIGDIDILIASKDLDEAFDLMVTEGYDQFVTFNYEVKNYRHRPRQISDMHLGAVELHDQLLKHNYNHLIDKDSFLSNLEIVDGIAIPNSEDLILNTILAHQINDRCYYYNTLKLKGVYDTFVLGLPENKTELKKVSKQKYGLAFINLVSVFSPSILTSLETLPSRFKKRTYQLSLNFPIFGKYLLQLKSNYMAISERIKLLVFNRSYRSHVLRNKLN